MSTNNSLSQKADPAVFGRGSLKLTFDLLRKRNPKLALDVRNICNGTPLEKLASEADNKDSDNFKVDLNSFQVREIVEILLKYSQNQNSNVTNIGMGVVSKTLTQDWMALARKMFDELPEDQKPGD